MGRYAWLEFEEGMWHLVTNLCADPRESTRRWSDRRRALADLMEEGWTVVRPYAPKHSTGGTDDGISGYGLVHQCHRAEPASAIMVDTTTEWDRVTLFSSFHAYHLHPQGFAMNVVTEPEQRRGTASRGDA